MPYRSEYASWNYEREQVAARKVFWTPDRIVWLIFCPAAVFVTALGLVFL